MSDEIDIKLFLLMREKSGLIVPTKETLFILARIEEIELYAKEKENGEFQTGLREDDGS